MGNLAAALNDKIEFSLMALILLSEDCNAFIPLPLCPITKNFEALNAFRPNSTPTKTPIEINNKIHHQEQENQQKTRNHLWRIDLSRVPERHCPAPDRGEERRRHGRPSEPFLKERERRTDAAAAAAAEEKMSGFRHKAFAKSFNGFRLWRLDMAKRGI